MLVAVAVRILLVVAVCVPEIVVVTLAQSSSCNLDVLDRSYVTQCAPNHCEPVLESEANNHEWPATRDEVVQIVSSRENQQRFQVVNYTAQDRTDLYYEESHVNGTLFVDTNVKYQRVLGFGTTLTDASVRNIDDLPDEIRSKLISDFFSVDYGIGLNLVRVPIGSTKYSFSNYALDQPDSDQIELSPYDTDHRVHIIKDAFEVAGKYSNRIKIVASSASAPAYLKDNNKLINGGYLKQNKIQDYAKYLTDFVAAYKAQGISIWALILSEYPVSVARDKGVNDTLDYSSMAMRPSEAIKLIRALKDVRQQGSEIERFRLLLLGDDRSHIPVWVDTVLRPEGVAGDVAGIAYVCDSRQDFAPYDNLIYASKRHPNKYLIAVQGTINSPIKLGNWQYAENYASEIIKNLEFGSVGWIDFNLALNLEGGPNLGNKFKADAAVMVDAKRRAYYRNPMFYAIGHLSRYIKPGSVRVKATFYSSPQMYASQHIAFISPDNYLTVVVLNNNIGPMPISIGIDTRTKVEALLETKSFNTFIFKLSG